MVVWSCLLSYSHVSEALIGCEAQIVKLNVKLLSCLVLSVVYIYNLLTIGSGALCFMHLVLGRSLNIF